jgi:hypothetical protein
MEIFTIVPISSHPAENSTENTLVCLHNLRHVAKYHGFDLREVHPEVLEPPNQSSGTSSPVRDKIGPTTEDQAFLDNFRMGTDVDRNDAEAVAMQEDIALINPPLL